MLTSQADHAATLIRDIIDIRALGLISHTTSADRGWLDYTERRAAFLYASDRLKRGVLSTDQYYA